MKTPHKSLYEAPQAAVFEIVTEGVIALSSDTEQVGVSSESYDDADFE